MESATEINSFFPSWYLKWADRVHVRAMGHPSFEFWLLVARRLGELARIDGFRCPIGKVNVAQVQLGAAGRDISLDPVVGGSSEARSSRVVTRRKYPAVPSATLTPDQISAFFPSTPAAGAPNFRVLTRVAATTELVRAEMIPVPPPLAIVKERPANSEATKMFPSLPEAIASSCGISLSIWATIRATCATAARMGCGVGVGGRTDAVDRDVDDEGLPEGVRSDGD